MSHPFEEAFESEETVPTGIDLNGLPRKRLRHRQAASRLDVETLLAVPPSLLDATPMDGNQGPPGMIKSPTPATPLPEGMILSH